MRTPKTTTQTLNDRTFASQPGLVIPSWAKVRLLQPEFFPSAEWKLQNPELWRIYQRFLIHIEEHLYNGDSRAAVVVKVDPYIVAAYTDELDCVALLRLPDDMSRKLKLVPGTRLLTVNTYRWLAEGLASDLITGPENLKRYGNFWPYIAEFYSDDRERIVTRKATISEEEFRRAENMGHQALLRGVVPRDGRPLSCSRPAMPQS